jgi:HD-GYP domain-containing protein (c-di-GMP phosphodiesterase class II)
VEKKWFVAFSEQVTVSLKLLNLYIEEKRIILSYIKAFSNLLSQHVPTSHIHHKSLDKLIKALGEALYLNEIEIKSLTFATLLHDAGKINLPEELLKKQSSLTDDEYRAIMSHPKKGVDLIKDLSSLKPVIPIILHHHERYDGKGYPSSLKKEKIPLGSRVLAILDAFDAMFFGRPYKEKVSMDVIEQELKKQRGHQFDPKIVDIFLKILKRKSIRKYLNSLR